MKQDKIFYLTFQGYADGIQQALIAVDFEEGSYAILQQVDSYDYEKLKNVCKIVGQDENDFRNEVHKQFNELESMVEER